MLARLDELKARLEILAGDDEHDAVLTGILQGVSAQLAVAARRVIGGEPCLEKADRTELITVPDRWTTTLFLTAWPVVSITEIKEAVYGGFDDADALVENEDYQLDAAAGRLHRIGYWMRGRLTVRVKCPAGYTPPTEYLADGYEAADGEVQLPADISEYAIQQASFYFQRRKSLGLTSQSVQGASVSTYAQDELLPNVAEGMKAYRRNI